MFGEAVFAFSNHKKPILLHKTTNSVYEFYLKHSYTSKTTNEATHSYTCVGCDQRKKKNTSFPVVFALFDKKTNNNTGSFGKFCVMRLLIYLVI